MITIPYTYNNLTLNSPADNYLYHVTRIDGLDSPSLRETRQDRAAMDGQIDWGSLLGERLITLRGEILATSSTQRDSARQSLGDAFIVDGNYHWLQYQISGQVAKQVYCKVLNLRLPERFFRKSPYIREFIINLIAVDPRILSQNQENKIVYIPSTEGGFVFPITFPLAFGTVQTGGKITCTNDGNYSVLPIVKMFAPLTNPKIRNNDDGQKEILINLTITGSDWLEIDFEEKTIMLNGTTSRYNYLGSSPDDWWKILPGNNEIEFRDSGGNTDGKAEIIFRSGWI